MQFELTASSGIIQKHAVDDLLRCNTFTQTYGLQLTHAQAVELVETRSYALSQNGRIEFGGGVINKLITAFCDSPYIDKDNYVPTIAELIQIFYYYKSDAMDLITDDELIDYMKNAFNTVCEGSLQLLAGKELEAMARDIRAVGRYDVEEVGH